MTITRHYLTIGGRRVHYRRCGNGPPLIMVHQSPRSSAEYEALMRDWGEHFTCIAPDTPGFGQSDPLAPRPDGADPEIGAYADALAEFVRALGIARTAAYGFHSGGIILVTALKRHADLFSGLAIGGYAIWTPEEMAIFGERYLPPFLPSPYGEHLTWLWNRILEQSWFFPWFDVRGEARLTVAHDDPARVHAVVLDMLDSGDAYRLGYGAVLRAPRDIPPPDARTCPVLISAYDGDPLQAHIDRLGDMPEGWSARKVATPREHQDASLAFLQRYAGPPLDSIPEDANAGFLTVRTDNFDGLIHWQGDAASGRLALHAPGREGGLAASAGLRIDLPGHGLSSPWPAAAPIVWRAWQAVPDAVHAHFGLDSVEQEPLPPGEPDRLYPDLTPDRFGTHLVKAWSIARARHLFAPWYHASASHAMPFDPAALKPEKLAVEHRALIRATAAKALHQAMASR
jgi:haloalkane dehalogenase